MGLRRFFSGLRARRTEPEDLRWHSVSSCREYDLCPRRYRYSFVDRLAPDRHAPEPWLYGTVVHFALEAAYNAQASGASATEVRKAALDALQVAWRRERLPDDPGGWRQAADQLVRRTLADDVLHVDNILGVEYRFRAQFDATIAFAGHADLVLRRDAQTVEIVDHKVTRKIVDADTLVHDQQLNLYGWLAKKQWPWARRIIATHHYPPAGTTTTVELTAETMVATMRDLVATARRADADAEYAPKPGAHCNTCSWAPRCPAAVNPNSYPRARPTEPRSSANA